MRNCGACGTWIPNGAGSCPSCGRDPGRAAAPPPPAPPPAGGGGPPPEDRLLLARRVAEARVRRLGVAFLVLGALVLLLVLLSFVQFATGEALRGIKEIREAEDDAFVQGMLRWFEDLYQEPWVLAVVHVVPFSLGALLVAAGNALRGLRGRALGIAAAIAAILFAPLTQACCCVAVPLGIYALVVLSRGDTEIVMRR